MVVVVAQLFNFFIFNVFICDGETHQLDEISQINQNIVLKCLWQDDSWYKS
jgi:hypothetical protein